MPRHRRRRRLHLHARLSLRDNLIALAGGIVVALAIVLLTLALT